MWTPASGGTTHGRVADACRRNSLVSLRRRSHPYLQIDVSLVHIQQSANRLAAVSLGAADLVHKVTLRPRGFAPGVPLGQERQGLAIREGEAAYEATTHPKGVQIPVLAG